MKENTVFVLVRFDGDASWLEAVPPSDKIEAIEIPADVWREYLAHEERERWWQECLRALDVLVSNRLDFFDRLTAADKKNR